MTGSRARQVEQYLKDQALSPTVLTRRIARVKTAKKKEASVLISEHEARLHAQHQKAKAIHLALEASSAQLNQAFAKYAYSQIPDPQAAKAATAARVPHIKAEVDLKSRPVAIKTARNTMEIVNAPAFLEVTADRRRTVQALDKAWSVVRGEALDADFNGVATLGRIAAKFTAAFVKARMRRLGPPEGTKLVVPEKQWMTLKDHGQLGKLYVRAQTQGWTLEMVGMKQEQHERLQKSATKAIEKGLERRQRKQGFELGS